MLDLRPLGHRTKIAFQFREHLLSPVVTGPNSHRFFNTSSWGEIRSHRHHDGFRIDSVKGHYQCDSGISRCASPSWIQSQLQRNHLPRTDRVLFDTRFYLWRRGAHLRDRHGLFIVIGNLDRIGGTGPRCGRSEVILQFGQHLVRPTQLRLRSEHCRLYRGQDPQQHPQPEPHPMRLLTDFGEMRTRQHRGNPSNWPHDPATQTHHPDGTRIVKARKIPRLDRFRASSSPKTI